MCDGPARDTTVVILSNLDTTAINPISAQLNHLATTDRGTAVQNPGRLRSGGASPQSPGYTPGQCTDTGPDARMTSCHVDGGAVFKQFPPDFAVTARMLSW